MRELCDRVLSRAVAHRRPAMRERSSRKAFLYQIVGADFAAVRDDGWIPELGRKVSRQKCFASQPSVTGLVEAHRMRLGEPDLVGHAASQLEFRRVESNAHQRLAGLQLGEFWHLMDSS